MVNTLSSKKNLSNLVFLFFIAFLSTSVQAAGLESATTALESIKTWLYGILGVGALVYLGYNVAMALMERKDWGEVAVALGKVALAGGALVGGTWALSLFA